MKVLILALLSAPLFAAPCVPHVPPGRHTDFIWPFSYIPRAWTAHKSCKPPITVFGNDHDADADDVPDPGHKVFQFSPKYGFMFSFQTKHHFLFRFGTMRYDFVDHYYEWPLAIRANHKTD